jgi:hypothetical protein
MAHFVPASSPDPGIEMVHFASLLSFTTYLLTVRRFTRSSRAIRRSGQPFSLRLLIASGRFTFRMFDTPHSNLLPQLKWTAFHPDSVVHFEPPISIFQWCTLTVL